MEKETSHVPVLLKEVLENLDIQDDDIVFDGTFGGGGHSRAIAEKLSADGVLIAVDQDENALQNFGKNLESLKPKIHLVLNNFKNIDDILSELGIKSVNKILLDLGWSTDQIEDSSRGLSYRTDGPLDMRLGEGLDGLTAEKILNEWDESSLVDIISGYGEERYAKKIAGGITTFRIEKPIKTTLELVEIIKNSVPAKYLHGKTHFAARTFQALRITVNDELGVIREFLDKGFSKLEIGGKMAIITFHSLEDRIVKNFFRDMKTEGRAELPFRKPLKSTDDEITKNNKARSAKLRILKRIN